MHLKTLALTAAFLAGSTLGVAAQSTSAPATGSANISAATHCKDKVTGEAKLKSAAGTTAPSGSGSMAGSASPSGSTTGSATSPSGSPSASGTMSGGAAGSGAGASGSVAATLPDCP